MKAGYLVKKKGVWFLTSEGESAMKLGERGLLDAATEAYREWASQRDKSALGESDEGKAIDAPPELTVPSIGEIEQLAIESLTNHIDKKNPYEFQDLAAALLRGMGYYTPFVAPKGKDGGADIVAYKDPLGTSSPRMKVQVKHRESPATTQDIRQLIGILQKDGDVGIFIASGGFTSDAKSTARSASVHVELIDLPRFVELWQEFYPKLSDEDKLHLPLLPVFFLAPSE